MMLAAFSLASCSSNDSEQDKPFTVCPEERVKFFVCEASGEDEGNPRYYLYDCYPAQFINDERTQANIKKNAMQWETFTMYLESKGKLKK